MAKPRKLTPDQHREVAERHLLYLKLRIEAARHSVPTMAREFGISRTTLQSYLSRKTA